ncbi:hypothetical protein [Streptomyces tendae]
MDRADTLSTPTGTAAGPPLPSGTNGSTGVLERARETLQAPPDPLAHALACLALARTEGALSDTPEEAHLRRALRHPDVPRSVKYQLRLVPVLGRLCSTGGEIRAHESPPA